MSKKLIYLLATLSLVLGLVISLLPPYLIKPLIEHTTKESPAPQPQQTIVTRSIQQVTTQYRQEEKQEFSLSYKDLYNRILKSTFWINMYMYLETYRTVPIPVVPISTDVESVSKTRSSPTTYGVGVEYSKTNVQVEGIDESDIVKNNERFIYILLPSKKIVYIYDSYEDRVLSKIGLGDINWKRLIGLYIYKNKLVVLGEIYHDVHILRISETVSFATPNTSTSVLIFDVSNSSDPYLVKSIYISGTYLSSRLNPPYLYIVSVSKTLSGEKPVLPLINSDPIPADNISVLSNITSFYTSILVVDLDTCNYNAYSYLTDLGSRIYMSNKHLYIISKPLEPYLIVWLELLQKLYDIYSKYVPKETLNEIIESIIKGDYKRVYEILIESNIDVSKINDELTRSLAGKYVLSDSSRIYVYDIDRMRILPRGEIVVSGGVLDQFSIEEYRERYFVIATTEHVYNIKIEMITYPKQSTDKTTSSHQVIIRIICSNNTCTTITITKEMQDRTTTATQNQSLTNIVINIPTVSWQGILTSNNVYIVNVDTMKIVGKLTGLAENERIYSARLLGDIFFLVTFRIVDPLYAINISDPENPRVIGFLKIPGFSEYLHPLYPDRLLGIGLEDNYLKISLFDISDPINMKEISVIKISNLISEALHDHHAVTIYGSKQLIIIPVTPPRFVILSSIPNPGFLIINYTKDLLNIRDFVEIQEPLRSVYIGDRIYLISVNKVKIYDINSGAVKEIELK